MSEPPPRTRTFWTLPTALRTVLLRIEGRGRTRSGEVEPAGQVADEHGPRVEPGAHLAPPVEVGVHRAEQLRPQPRVLREVHPPPGRHDLLVEAVEQRAQPAEGGR